jgi:two-component system, chemotaxis family, chemotaxis protein CheY
VKSVKAALRDVLVVDDDSSMRILLAEELRCRGYSVSVARNGREALDRLDVMTPDVIVLDLMMPVMDGWTFVKRYRDHARRRSVPIIAMSAAGDLPPGYPPLCVTAFFRKPFDLNELANCIAQLARTPRASVAPLSPETATVPLIEGQPPFSKLGGEPLRGRR